MLKNILDWVKQLSNRWVILSVIIVAIVIDFILYNKNPGYYSYIFGKKTRNILSRLNNEYEEYEYFTDTATTAKSVDQIIDLRTTLRYLGVPVNAKSFMFGDNQAVVNNSAVPHSSLNKRHNALAYHRVREMIAAKILGYYWIDGKLNPADIVRKHWSYPQIWHLLKPLLFYSGYPRDLIEPYDESNGKSENICMM